MNSSNKVAVGSQNVRLCLSEDPPARLCAAQVRAGEPVSNAELLRFAQLFNDELTLDNLERLHLVNLCRFVGIAPFGTDAFLRARLRSHLGAVKVRKRGFRIWAPSR
jgi:LETM1-like protein